MIYYVTYKKRDLSREKKTWIFFCIVQAYMMEPKSPTINLETAWIDYIYLKDGGKIHCLFKQLFTGVFKNV